MRRVLAVIGFWLMVAGVAAVMAAPPAEAPTAPTWREHWDVAQTVIVLLFGLSMWLLTRKINRIDQKFDELFKWRDGISDRLAHLEGEHEVMKEGCAARRGVSHA